MRIGTTARWLTPLSLLAATPSAAFADTPAQSVVACAAHLCAEFEPLADSQTGHLQAAEPISLSLPDESQVSGVYSNFRSITITLSPAKVQDCQSADTVQRGDATFIRYFVLEGNALQSDKASDCVELRVTLNAATKTAIEELRQAKIWISLVGIVETDDVDGSFTAPVVRALSMSELL